MENERHEFEMVTARGITAARGWYTEDGMIYTAQGICLGMRAEGRKKCVVMVYRIEDGARVLHRVQQ